MKKVDSKLHKETLEEEVKRLRKENAKLKNDSATKTFNFKERLCNVKLKDIDAFAKKHMSINWVTERTKQLKNVG